MKLHLKKGNIKTSLDDDNEDDEIEEIIKKMIPMSHISSKNEKSLEWLNFFFQEPEIKNLYLNHNRTKSMITLQCLYYLSLFKNLYSIKSRTLRIGIDTNENLPLIPFKNTFTNSLTLSKDDRQGAIMNFNSSTSVNDNLYNLNSNNNILGYKTRNFEKDKIQTYFKVGLVGCGNIGCFLLKNLIAIKDSSVMHYKIIVSTRRPTMVDADVLNLIDDEIEICLDNEKVFQECSVIFLCLQPHQLDLLVAEVSQTFKERIEKLKKKKNMIFPLIISTLAAVPLERLKMLFPSEVNIQRTYIDPKIMKKFSENNFYRDNFGKDRSKSVNIGNTESVNNPDNVLHILNEEEHNNNSMYSKTNPSKMHPKKEKEREKININKEIVKFTEESFLHMLKIIPKDTEFILNLLKSYHKAFYRLKRKSQEDVTVRKYEIVIEENYSNELVKYILGDDIIEKYQLFNNNLDLFIENEKEEVVESYKENYMKIIRNIYKGIE